MKIIASNRRAKHDYQITEKLIVGIALTGAEVKSAKAAAVSLKGSFVRVKGTELYLVNCHISPYKFAGNLDYNPTRERKLLAHRNQIDNLVQLSSAQGMTAVPLALGIERGLVKLEIGIGRGKKHYDKRASLRRKADQLDAARDLKSRSKTD